MQIPLEITFRNMDPSAAVEARLREKAEKLDRFHDHIMSCRIVVEAPHAHHHQGKLFQVRLDIKVPGKELAISHQGPKNHAHEDVYVAIRDAFNAAIRRLDEHLRRERGDVKAHEPPPHGRIAELSPELDCGRIETPDGRLIYFHRNSVLETGYDSLEIGSEVRFAEEPGDNGPQASSVHLVGKHHIVT
jgi:ribosomal subunit interface protein